MAGVVDLHNLLVAEAECLPAVVSAEEAVAAVAAAVV